MIAKKVYFDDIGQEVFQLLPKKITIGQPQVVTYLVSIPGRNGTIDFTESMTDGEVVFGDRTLTLEMYCFANDSELFKMESLCKNKLHGKKMKIKFDTDPDYYYYGRLSVDWVSDVNIDIATITATCKPFKYKNNPTVISESVSGQEKSIILNNGRMPVVPVVTTDSEITVKFNDKIIVFSEGIRSSPDLRLIQGENNLIINGTGSIKFEYTEGEL